MTRKDYSTDELIAMAIEQIGSDREQLLSLYNILERVARVNGEVEEIDVLSMKAISEDLVSITDSLTKQTGQIVDLAKLKQKQDQFVARDDDGAGSMTSKDLREVYEEIEGKN